MNYKDRVRQKMSYSKIVARFFCLCYYSRFYHIDHLRSLKIKRNFIIFQFFEEGKK